MTDQLSRRDFLKINLAGLASLGFAQSDRFQGDVSSTVPTIWKGSDRRRFVALTYDDCYLLRRMHDLEELLATYKEFKITLFPVGVAIQNLERQDAGIWKRFYENGHEIGYHSWDHGGIHVISPERALADFDRWMATLSEVIGYAPRVHFSRPPYGVLSPSFDAIAQARDQVVTMWSTGWGGELAVGLKAAQNSHNGDIVLMHIRTQDLNTSREAYQWLRDNDWGAVTLTKLYNDLLLEQNQYAGCDLNWGAALTRTCIE